MLSSIIREESFGGNFNTIMNTQETQIQKLLHGFLRSGGGDNTFTSDFGHLDEEMLAAFIEGALTEREAGPVVKHLVDCSFCRHVSAKLIRLDLALSDGRVFVPEPANHEPARVSEVLSGIFSRIFGSSEGAVFAHGEKNRDEETPEKPNDQDENQV